MYTNNRYGEFTCAGFHDTKNIISSLIVTYYTNSSGVQSSIPVLSSVPSEWLAIGAYGYTVSPATIYAATNENLKVRSNLVSCMNYVRRAVTVPVGALIEDNYFFNTPENPDTHYGINYGSEDAFLSDITFAVDVFSNSPRTITVEKVLPDTNTPEVTSLIIE